MKNKRQLLFIVLTGIFLTNAILAEIIGVKIFSAEALLGMPPANVKLFGGLILDFNLSAGVVIWPVVFITTDIINEYFGKKGVRIVSYLTVGCISFAFLVIYFITVLPPAQFWLDVNARDSNNIPFNVDYAFKIIFRQGLGIIVGSLVAFLIGQLLDVYIFQKLRRFTGTKMVWLRATGSTLVSQFIDSFVVIAIAFYLLAPEGARWPFYQVVSVGIINYTYKFGAAVLLTPLIYLAHHLIDRFLGRELSGQLQQKAAEGSKGFF